jgi:hypothetical protein
VERGQNPSLGEEGVLRERESTAGDPREVSRDPEDHQIVEKVWGR